MGRVHVVLVAAVCTLIAVPAASAKTIRLNWTERIPAGFGYPVLEFHVTGITYDDKHFAVHASVKNRSKSPVKIHQTGKNQTLPRFGVKLPPVVCRWQRYPSCLSGGSILVAATTFSKPLPAVLNGGATWRGTFSGDAPMHKSIKVAVTFGNFVAPRQQKGFSWATQHVVKLR
jgi:hypothetical protein